MNTSQLLSLKQRALTFRSETHLQRKERLKKLLKWIELNEHEIIAATKADFNKPAFETLISEIIPTITELKHSIKNLKSWMKDSRVPTPLSLFGHTSYIRHENKGVVLIIAPWNYPFGIAVAPMIAAVSAGNTIVLKPSELTTHTSELLKKMVESVFYSNEALVALGGKEKTEELLELDFDHVFFTGSTAVGKIIAEKCSKKLIPYTLELGGKSPLIIDNTADLDLATDRVLWAKFLNRGQTCIAPDFACVHESVVERFISLLNEKSQKLDSENKANIITPRHEKRLNDLLGKGSDIKERALVTIKIENKSHPLMQDEIFGPILPVLSYKSDSDLFNLSVSNEKPLALYIFSKKNDFINRALENIPSGGAAINSVLVHFGNHHLPFGGIGHSGVGRYHGKFGFDEMSHQRAVIRQSFASVARFVFMPPYSDYKVKIANLFKNI